MPLVLGNGSGTKVLEEIGENREFMNEILRPGLARSS